jgi:chitodextrinase
VIHKLANDMQAVQPYVSSYLSFSFNHYMSPQQVNPLYYKTYMDYLASGKVESEHPTKPSDLKAVPLDSTTISLSWKASTDNFGVAGYKIWRNEKHVATLYDRETGFADSGLEPNTTYTYQVAAFDAAGNRSELSDPATATTPPADKYKIDLALGKPYTATMAADPNYPDTGGAELTDGIFGTIDYTDPAWQGRNTDQTYSFTIDLAAMQDIKELRSRWLQYKSVGIFLPKSVTYSISNDGVNFTVVGTVKKPAVGHENQPAWYTITDLSNVNGRYVKLEITLSTNAWTFVDEAEVRQ